MNIFFDKRGQGFVIEYAVTFFLVVAFVSIMTMYVKRTVQGRIHLVAKYATDEAQALWLDPSTNLVGNFYAQYEPYYVSVQTQRTAQSAVQEQLRPTGRTGIFDRATSGRTVTRSSSFQAAPVNAD